MKTVGNVTGNPVKHLWSGGWGVTARRLTAVVAAVAPLTLGLTVVSSQASTPSYVPTSVPRAFDLPSTDTLQASPRKVFAHYMPNFIVSLDNKDASSDYYTRNYLDPNGEGGKHVAYGGFLRNRPLPRPVRSGTTAQWKQADMEEEVRSAISSGIDGFSLDLLQVPGNSTTTLWDYTLTMMRAAANVDADFKIMIMPDMTAGPKDQSAAELASHVATLASYSSAYRLADGRLVVSPFAAEVKTVDWWTQFMSIAKSPYGLNIALVPVFVNDSNRMAYASISYGLGNWGSRNPLWNNPTQTGSGSKIGMITQALDAGKIWMQPVSFQDERPRSAVYDEAENTTNLRNTWQIAIDGKAPWVQMVTWNDFSEGSEFEPSATKGWSALDLNAYYLTWFKTGVQPRIVRDGVFLTHRKQPNAATPTFAETKLMKNRGGSVPRDMVEALTFTSAASTVSVTVGSTTTTCQVDAGVDTCLVPLKPGSVKASLARNGATLATVSSPFAVTNTPYTQDLQYVAVNSWRDGTTTPAPTTTTTTSTPTPTTTSPTTTSPTTTTSSPTPTTTTSSPSPTATAGVPVTSTTTTTKPTTTSTSTPPTTSTTAPTTTASAGALKVTVEASADTYANEGAPSTTYGDSSSLSVRGSIGAIGYLKFPMPATPSGKSLYAVRLRVRTGTLSYAGSYDTMDVKNVTNVWDEAKLAWSGRPTPGTTTLGSLVRPSGVDTVYRISLVKDSFAKAANSTVAVALTDSGTDSIWLWASEHPSADYRPVLELEYR